MTETAYSQRIDSHHHLWQYTPEEFGWIGDDMASLRRDFLLEDLRRELALAGVDGTVAVQARQTLEETDWLLEVAEAEDSPVRGVVGWLPIASARFPAVLEAFRDSNRLCGLRHIVQGEQPGFLDGDAFNQGIAQLRDTGLVYDILIYARQLEEAIRFVDRHPKQSFVLDHIAKPDIRNHGFAAWEEGFRELARRDNVTCKLSGMVTETDWNHWLPAELHPYFETAFEVFSANRLMIGTDWPVITVGCTYSNWWKTVEDWTAALSQQERNMVLGGTATRVYNLRS